MLLLRAYLKENKNELQTLGLPGNETRDHS